MDIFHQCGSLCAPAGPQRPQEMGEQAEWSLHRVVACLGAQNPNRTPSLISIISLWQTSFNPLGLVVSQPAMNFGLLCTEMERFSVYFRKTLVFILLQKRAKGELHLKVFKRSLPKSRASLRSLFLFSSPGFTGNVTIWGHSRKRMSLSSASLGFSINRTVVQLFAHTHT